MSDTSCRIIPRLAIVLIVASLPLLTDDVSQSNAHQDGCHRQHSCPSDHQTYVCGDKGRCGQCPDKR
jgi:hypothetical protein